MEIIQPERSTKVVNLGKYFSTWRDSDRLDSTGMNQGAMMTVIGLVAGLAIAALLVFARDLYYLDDILKPKVVFSVAVAGLFATSAFGRAKTHFAKEKPYTFSLLVLDVFMVLTGGFLVALLSREDYRFDEWTWIWLGLFLLLLEFRNFILASQFDVAGLRIGILFILVAVVADVLILLRFPYEPMAALLFGIIGFVLMFIQFWVEILNPFRKRPSESKVSS